MSDRVFAGFFHRSWAAAHTDSLRVEIVRGGGRYRRARRRNFGEALNLDTHVELHQGERYSLVGNWSGNGMVDQVVFRPSAGIWYVRNGATGAASSLNWGGNGDIPLIGAWSGQMRDAVAWRPSTGVWWIRFGNNGSSSSFQFGLPGDQPMVGNVFGHGIIDQIVYRPSTATWYVRDGQTGTVWSFGFGSSAERLVHE